MRPNSENLATVLTEKNLSVSILVGLEWNQNHYFTDMGRDVYVNSVVYKTNQPIVSFDPLSYSSVVNRELFNFELSALDSDMKTEIGLGITHKPVQINMMFSVNGVAIVDPAFILPLYRGYVSKVEESIDEEQRLFSIQCTAPLSDLDAIGTLYTTNAGMEVYSTTDTSFDTVNDNSRAITLKWGKI
jgi:hypothetical protein